MKKTTLSVIFLVMALGAMMLVQSCKKDNDGSQIFYATIQQYEGDKVHIDNRYSCWDEGDNIVLHSWPGTVGYDESEHRYYIHFPNQIIGLSDGSHYANELRGAMYPLELWEEGATDPTTFNVEGTTEGSYAINQFHLGPTQLYETASDGSQKIQAPMVAVMNPATNYTLPNTDNVLEFKNICAMMEVTVNTSTPIIVTRIEVENSSMETMQVASNSDPNTNVSKQKGRPLWGNFEITFIYSDNTVHPILRETTNTDADFANKLITKEVTLECEHHGNLGGVNVSSSHPFYIYLPPVHYKNLRVTVYAKENAGTENETEKCITLTSTVEGNFVANTIYPLAVTYGRGNWVDVPREHTLGPYTVNTSGKQVMFAFSNLHNDDAGYFFPPYQYDFIGYHDPNNDHDHFTVAQRNAMMSPGDENTDPGWAIANDYTILTQAEWSHLINTRSGNRFAHALVASVPGIILFPDGYTPPQSIINPNSINHTEAQYTYTDNIISIADFYVLENAGCVFLPCVNYSTGDASSIEDFGYYWTSQGSNAYDFALGNISSVNLGNYGSPAFIRLVKVITTTK